MAESKPASQQKSKASAVKFSNSQAQEKTMRLSSKITTAKQARKTPAGEGPGGAGREGAPPAGTAARPRAPESAGEPASQANGQGERGGTVRGGPKKRRASRESWRARAAPNGDAGAGAVRERRSAGRDTKPRGERIIGGESRRRAPICGEGAERSGRSERAH
jgi:hypothetical protein